MKTILEFLLSKSYNKVKNNDYYIVWPVGDIFDLVAYKFDDNADCKVRFEDNYENTIEMFILSIPEILDTIETSLTKKVNKSTIEEDFRLYKIPNGYNEDTIKDAIQTHKVNSKDLERVNIDDLK